MNKISCVALMGNRALSPAQLADLQAGSAAVEAFWAAVQADPFLQQPGQWPLYRCIFAALCVHDILHSIGREDAVLFRTGLEVRRQMPRALDRAAIIGDPSAPQLSNMWNAHMVVRLGDILLDPSHGQTKRDWNESPHAAAFLFGEGDEGALVIAPGFEVKVNTMYRRQRFEVAHRVTYFELPWSVDVRTRKWRKAGDAKPERRRALVEHAIAICLNRQMTGSGAFAA